ncbi:DoxX family protein [Shinella sp.]|uniref:DoxX family protein n=1 Tax=Shinella sp. TaxID=1870904 RepID=UPI0025858975|nr:DoxX family protein [Shinella sp.]MCW5710800.1 DoxX family protein [Shinella sp.]
MSQSILSPSLSSRLAALLAWPLAAFFLFGAYGNAFLSADNAAAYERWGYPDWFPYLTAALELAAALLLIPVATRRLGAALGTAVMAAATLTTLINQDYAHTTAPAIVLVVSLIVLAVSRPRT